jgi:hypothetical protein
VGEQGEARPFSGRPVPVRRRWGRGSVVVGGERGGSEKEEKTVGGEIQTKTHVT